MLGVNFFQLVNQYQQDTFNRNVVISNKVFVFDLGDHTFVDHSSLNFVSMILHSDWAVNIFNMAQWGIIYYFRLGLRG